MNLKVRSETNAVTEYTVTVDDLGTVCSCTCPSRIYRPHQPCKHMRAVCTVGTLPTNTPPTPPTPPSISVQVPVGGRHHERIAAALAEGEIRLVRRVARVQPWVDARAAWVAAQSATVVASTVETVRHPKDLAEYMAFAFNPSGWQ